jgi:hypothetical protein
MKIGKGAKDKFYVFYDFSKDYCMDIDCLAGKAKESNQKKRKPKQNV